MTLAERQLSWRSRDCAVDRLTRAALCLRVIKVLSKDSLGPLFSFGGARRARQGARLRGPEAEAARLKGAEIWSERKRRANAFTTVFSAQTVHGWVRAFGREAEQTQCLNIKRAFCSLFTGTVKLLAHARAFPTTLKRLSSESIRLKSVYALLKKVKDETSFRLCNCLVYMWRHTYHMYLHMQNEFIKRLSGRVWIC